ncbi:MAG: hypothetical protein PVSMB7_29620 [Chloroflexota bacterium]
MRLLLRIACGLTFVLVLAMPAVTGRHGNAVAASTPNEHGTLQFVGVSSLHRGGSTTGSQASHVGALSWRYRHRRGTTDTRVPTVDGIIPSYSSLTTANPGWHGFNGITAQEQALAGYGSYAGTNASATPPDQGLCVGNGVVLEAVNLAIVAYTPQGNRLTPVTALNQFLFLPPEYNPTTGGWGPYLSDPRCYFDVATGRWFFTILELSADPSTGNPDGKEASLYVAVSETGYPVGGWAVFRLPATLKAGAQCPCFPDQPLIGADAYGFYITGTSVSITSNTAPVNGSVLWAMSKSGLERAASSQTGTGTHAAPFYVVYGPQRDGNGNPLSAMQPTTVPGTTFARADGGTEYFIAQDDTTFTAPVNQIVVWALTGTSSLDSGSKALHLQRTFVPSEVYADAPPAQQKDGPRPLTTRAGGCAKYGICGAPVGKLDTGDDVMNAAVYAHGLIWAALDTGVLDSQAKPRDGVAWFIVSPGAGGFSPSVVNTGYIAIDGENLLYPTVGINDAGRGVVALSLMGPHHYPSVAYAPIDYIHGTGTVHLAVAGNAPSDDLSDYAGSTGPDWPGYGRWGDYTAAVAATDGSIWTAIEYIPNLPREPFDNWGTYIGNYRP